VLKVVRTVNISNQPTNQTIQEHMGGIPAKMYKLMKTGNRNLLEEHP